MTIDVFANQQDILGEGPIWSERDDALYWLDIGRCELHRRTIEGHAASWTLPARPGCVENRDNGELVIAMGSGLFGFNPKSEALTLLQSVPLAKGVRFNEGKVDPCGRLWFGAMQDNFGPDGAAIPLERYDGSLFRADGAGRISVIEEGIGISNTLAWSPDHQHLYFADSLLGCIFVYDYDLDTGEAVNRRVFFDENGLGLPDGSAIDTDGCLWNARWGAGLILRLTPDGRIDRRIEMPVTQPSSCIFGGPGRDTLFITSASNGLDDQARAREPLCGAVFGISGLAVGPILPEMAWGMS